MKLAILPSVVFAALGVLLGIGGTTFNYAEGLSYLSTDPAACANCHIMQPQYDAWQKASHHTAATCADCHLPPGFPEKYVAKAENGWNHSKAFTLQDFPEPIVITKKNADILHANCLRCHADLVHDQAIAYTEGAPRCVRCHVTVGHGEPVGLGGPMALRQTKETSEP
ncbi:MAG TPA: cytochrome c nitrite reductase small subunit [Myxococcota bacterium]|nr:cytochrome c nitrite reductase small subunit [Myxococcota bacterium]HPC92064.1 cytochrome c nitrite reductase small subunit [Myxococcota bacterium]HPL24305.1 cytochrome c nitrite reductase small subunit [Myxococcota bacterium]HQE72890.1 cytochrome c nitrite reductase small subunit [Myxococcota bacterium]HRR73353.1 cytochrome c nitrite reductase small subunit [Myxococcota bacterium]